MIPNKTYRITFAGEYCIVKCIDKSICNAPNHNEWYNVQFLITPNLRLNLTNGTLLLNIKDRNVKEL